MKHQSLADAVRYLALVAIAALTLQAQHPGTLIYPGETDPLILEFGQEAVDGWLAIHLMSSSEIDVIRTYGRQDLHDTVRAMAWTRLQSILMDSTRPLNAKEQRAFDQFANAIKALRVAPMEHAVAEKNRFLADRCKWKPDPDVAKSAGYTWDGTYWCPQPVYAMQMETQPSNPSKEYFIAYGQKKAWIDPIASRPGGLRSISQITLGGMLLLGIGIPAAIGIALAIPAVITTEAIKVIIFTKRIVEGVRITGNVSFIWIGVGISVALMLVTLVIAIYLFTENERVAARYPELDQELTKVKAEPTPDRATVAAMMQIDAGRNLLYSTFLQRTIPGSSYVSTAPLPSRVAGVDPLFVVQTPGSGTSTAAEQIRFAGWGTEIFTAKMWKGWFLTTANVAVTGVDLTAINTRLRYRWNGKRYEADRMGSVFAVMKHELATGDVDCATDPDTGLTTASDLTKCKTLVLRTLEMDLDVGRRLVSVSQDIQFTSPATAGVALGGAKQIAIAAIGLPAPSLSASGLPSGFSFTDNGGGTGTLSWSGSGVGAGTYDITLRAQSGEKSAVQRLNVSVADVLRWLKPGDETVEGALGELVTVHVTALGNPTPTVTQTSAVPGNCGLVAPSSTSTTGTLTISGRITHSLWGGNCLLQFTTYNGTTPVGYSKTITIKVNGPLRQPTLESKLYVAPAVFTTEHLITTKGSSSPGVQIQLGKNSSGQVIAPSWVTLTDNWNGTAVLKVTPPQSGPDSVFIPLWYGITNTVGNDATQTTDGVWLKIQKTPWYDNTEQFAVFRPGQVGSVYSESRLANAPAWYTGTLPAGVNAYPQDPGKMTFLGYVTEPGDFRLEIKSGNRFGESTQNVRIVAVEPAKITSPQRVNFYFGKTNTFEVTATGFPIQPLINAPDNAPDNMNIWYEPVIPNGTMPSGLEWVTTDSTTLTPLFGRAIIRGNPVARGIYGYRIKAQTAGLAVDTKDLILVLTDQGDVNGDLAVNCNDVTFLTSRYGARRGTANYDYNADYNQDGTIDVRDTALVVARMPAGTRCQ